MNRMSPPGAVRRPALAVAAIWLSLSWTTECKAQTSAEPVAPGARGTLGGLLLGAEVVMLAEAALGVRPTWAFLAGAGAGAIGGVIGGYYSDEAGNTPVSMTLLVAGLLLAVPTTIAVLDATSYRAPKTDDGGSASAASGARPVERTVTPQVGLSTTPALAEYRGNALALRVPAVEISSVFSPLEHAIYGAPRATRWWVPVLQIGF